MSLAVAGSLRDRFFAQVGLLRCLVALGSNEEASREAANLADVVREQGALSEEWRIELRSAVEESRRGGVTLSQDLLAAAGLQVSS